MLDAQNRLAGRMRPSVWELLIFLDFPNALYLIGLESNRMVPWNKLQLQVLTSLQFMVVISSHTTLL
jgi:hypothetical protein